ncbi:MAG: hypothetical protein ABI865_09255 [Nitrosospira sp.]
MCNVDLSNSGFLGFGVDEDAANKRADEVLRLMARNYAIVEELQGHETVHYSSIHYVKGKKK